MLLRLKLLINKYPKVLSYSIGYINGITTGFPIGYSIYYLNMN